MAPTCAQAMCRSKVQISPDALRMRVRRLCERKVSGKCHVPPEVRDDYVKGGESREIIELALLDALAKHVVSSVNYKKVKASRDQNIFLHVHACMHMIVVTLLIL